MNEINTPPSIVSFPTHYEEGKEDVNDFPCSSELILATDSQDKDEEVDLPPMN